MNIIFNKDKNDSLMVGAQPKFTQLDIQTFSMLPHDKRSEFFQDLRYTLLKINIEYVVYPSPPSKIEFVQIMKPVYFDGLTKGKLFNTTLLVRRAIELTKWCFGKHLRPRGGSSISPSFRLL